MVNPRAFLELGRFRDHALRSLIRDAYARVRSFRERMDTDRVDPRSVLTVQDLQRIPIVTRNDLLSSSLADRLRTGTIPERCVRARTSGTSGTPLIVHMGPSEALYRRILLFRAFAKYTRLIFPLSVTAVGVNTVKLAENTANPSHLLGLIRVVPISRHLDLEEQAYRLLASSPQVISGPPSCLELISEQIRDMPRPKGFRPRLIAPRGEVLHPATRVHLEEVFRCTVADFYSCEEIGNVAWECPSTQGLYHIQQGACWVETVGSDGSPVPPGTPGDVVLTNLFNRTMPFIRYRLGDRATLLSDPVEPCQCGHRGASLSLLEGRAEDFLLLPSGERVSPRTIVGLVCSSAQRDDNPTAYYMTRFQVVQTALNRVTVRIVPGLDAPDNLSARIEATFRRFAVAWRVNVELVKQIPQPSSGKLPTIASTLGANHSEGQLPLGR